MAIIQTNAPKHGRGPRATKSTHEITPLKTRVMRPAPNMKPKSVGKRGK